LYFYSKLALDMAKPVCGIIFFYHNAVIIILISSAV